MKLIDKAAVVAEIERRWRSLANKNLKSNGKYDIEISTLLSIKTFLDTLEVKEEVDLEKELDSQWKNCTPVDEGMGCEFANISIEQFTNIAEHFFKLGLAQER